MAGAIIEWDLSDFGPAAFHTSGENRNRTVVLTLNRLVVFCVRTLRPYVVGPNLRTVRECSHLRRFIMCV